MVAHAADLSVSLKFNRLPEIHARFNAAVRAIIRKAVFDAQAIAMGRAPVDTGNLRNSISVDFDEGVGRILGTVYTAVLYAAYVEYGTRYMAAQPYMTPAAEIAFASAVAAFRTLERLL